LHKTLVPKAIYVKVAFPVLIKGEFNINRFTDSMQQIWFSLTSR